VYCVQCTVMLIQYRVHMCQMAVSTCLFYLIFFLLDIKPDGMNCCQAVMKVERHLLTAIILTMYLSMLN